MSTKLHLLLEVVPCPPIHINTHRHRHTTGAEERFCPLQNFFRAPCYGLSHVLPKDMFVFCLLSVTRPYLQIVFADVIKLRGTHTNLKMGPNPMTSIHLKGKKCKHSYTGRSLHDDRGRDRNDASISQPRTISNSQKLGRVKEQSSLRAFRRRMALSAP